MIEWWFLALLPPMEHPGKYEYFMPPPIVLEEFQSQASCEAAFKINLRPLMLKGSTQLVCVMMPIGGHYIDECKLEPPLFPELCKGRAKKGKG